MKSPATLAEACSETYTDADKLSQCSFYMGAMKAVEIIGNHANDAVTIAVCRTLIDEVAQWLEARNADEPRQIQTSGPRCKNCGAFTTYKRVNSHGLCMKCEGEANADVP